MIDSSSTAGVEIANVSDRARFPAALEHASHVASVTTCNSSTINSDGLYPINAAGSAGNGRNVESVCGT
jgi:hypothetical protein